MKLLGQGRPIGPGTLEGCGEGAHLRPRDAPKIQVVVALVLVPSVLLMIVAAIVAHSEALFGQLQAPG